MKQFGSQAKKSYRQFVAEGIKEGIRTPWDEVRGQMVMGSEKLVDRVMNRHSGKARRKNGFVGRKELVGIKAEAIMAAVGKYYDIKPEENRDLGKQGVVQAFPAGNANPPITKITLSPIANSALPPTGQRSVRRLPAFSPSCSSSARTRRSPELLPLTRITRKGYSLTNSCRR